ncbi:hypothetical protein GO491_05970 [Flavobacteriaceae bacterium Ap0902]|nr:hypothetical protein [Flavobacteriaceae bacterium Ap0902]
MNSLKINFIRIAIFLTYSLAWAQTTSSWENEYSIQMNNEEITHTFQIIPNPDESSKEITCGISKPCSYIITSRENDNKIIAKPLIYDLDKGINEYAPFGWTNLRAQGKIECLQGDALFICKTAPDTMIPLDEEDYFTKTGIFTIIPDQGFVDINILVPSEQ